VNDSQVARPRRPEVGAGVLVLRECTVLLGLRRGSHGAGTWGPPGGHVEYGEDPIACVRRETLEEAGIDLGVCEFAGVTNDMFAAEGRHYVTLFYTSRLSAGEPTVREPSKCEAWRWWPWQDLPENLFLPLRHLREQGFVPPRVPDASGAPGQLRRVCVFCGSNYGANPAFREAAESLGRLLAGEQIELVYGGGSVGLMGAVADAVRAAGGRVIGVIPEALVQAEIAHRELDDLRVVRSMHERKQLMADLADAFVALPGGFGTFEELLEIVTWAQLGLHSKPIGLLNVGGYYDALLALVQRAVSEGFVARDHARLLYVDEQPLPLLARLRADEPRPLVRKWLDRTQA
jgi:uncharacterized protein (TIGR00730 family)